MQFPVELPERAAVSLPCPGQEVGVSPVANLAAEVHAEVGSFEWLGVGRGVRMGLVKGDSGFT